MGDESVLEAMPADVLEARPEDGERLRRLIRDHLGGVVRYLGRLGIPAGDGCADNADIDTHSSQLMAQSQRSPSE